MAKLRIGDSDITDVYATQSFMSGVLVYINPLVPAMSMALPAASSQVWRDFG